MKPIILAATTAIASSVLLYSSKTRSPLDGYWPTTSPKFVPIESVWYEGHARYPLTNWVFLTNNDSSPKVITSYLKAPKNNTAAVGQVWFSGFECYINEPKVFVWPKETNNFFGDNLEERRSTNYWPVLDGHMELIYVRAIDMDGYYARCRVRVWGRGTTSYCEADSTLLVEYLTNTATLLK